jgi:hypothetical protein
MKNQFGNILSYTWPLQRHDTTHIAIQLFLWQMTYLEFANDVVHLHNIER